MKPLEARNAGNGTDKLIHTLKGDYLFLTRKLWTCLKRRKGALPYPKCFKFFFKWMTRKSTLWLLYSTKYAVLFTKSEKHVTPYNDQQFLKWIFHLYLLFNFWLFKIGGGGQKHGSKSKVLQILKNSPLTDIVTCRLNQPRGQFNENGKLMAQKQPWTSQLLDWID